MPAARIIDHVAAAHCVPALAGSSREDVIQEIVDAFVTSGALAEQAAEIVVESVLEREEAATTGIGNGVALPHPKSTDDVSALLDAVLVGVGIHAEGVDFVALDGDPVHLVFLVVSPGKVEYLEVAKRIAALAKGGTAPEKWRRVLRQARTPAALREALEEAWEELAP
jgi:mannitol/fructose-specific phosphotransferase system IIA component (Ntr-type)